MIKRLDHEFMHDNYLTVGEMERILLDHIDGKRVAIPPPHTRARMLVTLMIERDWLERHTRTTTGMPCFPQSSITEEGRGILARLLAEHADRLVTAHFKASEARDSKAVALLQHPSPDRPTTSPSAAAPPSSP